MTFNESIENSNDEMSNQEKYQISKNNMLNSIEQETPTIILVGSGSNGKSYLTNELNNVIQDKGYYVYSPDVSCSWSQHDFTSKVDDPEKKVIHFPFNPLQKWNLQPRPELSLINMEDIRW